MEKNLHEFILPYTTWKNLMLPDKTLKCLLPTLIEIKASKNMYKRYPVSS